MDFGSIFFDLITHIQIPSATLMIRDWKLRRRAIRKLTLLPKKLKSENQVLGRFNQGDLFHHLPEASRKELESKP